MARTQLKIRRGVVVDDIPLLPPVSCVAFVQGIAVMQAPEVIVNNSPSVSFPTGPASLTENFRRSEKRKAVVGRQGEMIVPKRGMEDAEDPQKARRGPEDSSSGIKDRVLHDRGAS
ncbi:hypothetical protein Fot_41589 [Forsythia ovata]|uniref:Uncharacterized protein n=1 Tax=Forsythia ovata TaxID=205694 RepID=A0ABD1RIP9_9LAMI